MTERREACEHQEPLQRVQYDDWTLAFRLSEDGQLKLVDGYAFKWGLYQRQQQIVEVSTVGSSSGSIEISGSLVTVNVDRTATALIPPGSYTWYLQSIDQGNVQKTWTPAGLPMLVLPGVQL